MCLITCIYKGGKPYCTPGTVLTADNSSRGSNEAFVDIIDPNYFLSVSRLGIGYYILSNGGSRKKMNVPINKYLSSVACSGFSTYININIEVKLRKCHGYSLFSRKHIKHIAWVSFTDMFHVSVKNR